MAKINQYLGVVGLMKFLHAEALANPQVAEAIRVISEAALKNKA